MNKYTNPRAELFTKRIRGTLESFRGLHLVTYNYGSSPSLAYWTGRQKKATKNIHFLSNDIRLKYIAELRQKNSILYRAKYRLQRQLQRIAGSVMA